MKITEEEYNQIIKELAERLRDSIETLALISILSLAVNNKSIKKVDKIKRIK